MLYLVTEWLDEVGVLDEDGEPRSAYALQRAWEGQAAALRGSLGVSPDDHGRLLEKFGRVAATARKGRKPADDKSEEASILANLVDALEVGGNQGEDELANLFAAFDPGGQMWGPQADDVASEVIVHHADGSTEKGFAPANPPCQRTMTRREHREWDEARRTPKEAQ